MARRDTGGVVVAEAGVELARLRPRRPRSFAVARDEACLAQRDQAVREEGEPAAGTPDRRRLLQARAGQAEPALGEVELPAVFSASAR